ncbi:hypothetical protein CF327_g965 [Tilletia walkeri]|uniref:Uncharacterized protein n=1 Tax=Tilletia walkeri TaxID=117179 RepID=A0A8X7N932_9BASI|nr:hypothetical protein CF327_g965 [Tilletia walkeri]KAE8269506.1 hypothetical protein A4X09_0g2834 [Tilletia walkeri]
MLTSSAASSSNSLQLDSNFLGMATATPSQLPQTPLSRTQSTTSSFIQCWGGPPPSPVKHKKKRRPKTTHGTGIAASAPKSPPTPKSILSFLWDKEKGKTCAEPQRTSASAKAQPIFLDESRVQPNATSSPTQGQDLHDYTDKAFAILPSAKGARSMSATYGTSFRATRSSVSSSDRRTALDSSSLSSSSLAPSSYQMTSQSSIGGSSSQRLSIHSLNVSSNLPNSIRPNSLRSNSASAASLGDDQSSTTSGPQTRSWDNHQSSRSKLRVKGSTRSGGFGQTRAYYTTGQISGKTAESTTSTPTADPNTKASLAADRAFAAMFPYDGHSLRRPESQIKSRPLSERRDMPQQQQRQTTDSTVGTSPLSTLSASQSGDVSIPQDHHLALMRTVSPKTIATPIPVVAKGKAPSLRRPGTADGRLSNVGGESTRKQRGRIGTRISAWFEKI